MADAYTPTSAIQPEDQHGEMQGLQLLAFFAEQSNIIEYIDDNTLSLLGQRCRRGLEDDENSIAEWMRGIDKLKKVAGQETAEKTYPWPGASNVKYPLILTAALQFNARAYPVIISNDHPALVKTQGEDPYGQKKARADRVSTHMSYQILEEMEEWEGGTDALLLALPIQGHAWKKVYYSEELGRNVSDFVEATDAIVNNNTKSIATCQRLSHLISLYQYEVQERINYGTFRDRPDAPLVDLEKEDDEPLEFVEQHTLYDLDGDGYPEPYIVTFERKSSFVVRVAANFHAEEIKADPTGRILRIPKRDYFVPYKCFEDPEGGFYGKGFGQLLAPINDTIDTLINQLIDAGTLANTGGGFVAKGFRGASGSLRFEMGEYKKVDVMGGSLRDSIMPLTFPEPSNVLFMLLGLLIDAGKDIASIQEVVTGGGGQNMPATSVLALIEQGTKVYTAIFKRIWRSLKMEFKLLYDLNRRYLQEEQYFNFLDDEQAIAPKDYEARSLDIVPAADPNMATDFQQAARANALREFAAEFPDIANRQEVFLEGLEAIGISQPERFVAPPPTEPSPEEQIQLAELNLEFMKHELDADNSRFKQLKDFASSMKTLADTDELGGNNPLAVAEAMKLLRFMDLIVRKNEEEDAITDDRGPVPGLEGRQ